MKLWIAIDQRLSPNWGSPTTDKRVIRLAWLDGDRLHVYGRGPSNREVNPGSGGWEVIREIEEWEWQHFYNSQEQPDHAAFATGHFTRWPVDSYWWDTRWTTRRQLVVITDHGVLAMRHADLRGILRTEPYTRTGNLTPATITEWRMAALRGDQ